ncbi:hypothetical protein NL533_35455, partial [Klebsiella pneumoniae]|nr:hypothetical protein [Klebsiella pneumoniae]
MKFDQRLSASLRLPRESSLDIHYLRTARDSSLVVRLKATIFKRRESASYLGASVVEAVKLGSVAGRVF